MYSNLGGIEEREGRIHTLDAPRRLPKFAMTFSIEEEVFSGLSARPSWKSRILDQLLATSSGSSLTSSGKPTPPERCHLVRPHQTEPTSYSPPLGVSRTFSLQRARTRGAM